MYGNGGGGFDPNGPQFQGGTGMAPIAGSAPPANVPQPPPQAAPGAMDPHSNPDAFMGLQPTLAQGNGEMGANPYLDQYTQAMAGALQGLRPFMEPPIPAPPPENPAIRLLKGIGTFGISELKRIADENTRGEENYRRFQNNKAIGMKGADLATKMVDAQVTAAGLSGRMGIQNQRLMLEQQRFINDLLDKQRTQARLDVNDQFKFNTIPAPMGADAIDAASTQGYRPSTRFPGRWERGGDGGSGGGTSPRLVQDKSGAWVDPNSPAGQALAATGGADTGAGGGDIATRLRARTSAAKGQEKTTTEDAAAAAETMRNMKLVESWLNAPEWKQGVGLLPPATTAGAAESVAGPARAYYHQFKGTPGANYFATANTNVMPALRAMEAGAKNMRIAGQVLGDFGVKKQMGQLQNFRMSQMQAEDFKKTLLDRFKQIREQLGTGDSGPDSTTATPTSSTPPSTGGPTQPTPSTGSTPGSLDSLLKKHNY